MNTELLEALTILEKEKNISKDVMMEAIENSLLSACKNHFGTSDNIKIVMDRETCDYSVFAEKEVVEEVFDPAIEISLEDAEKINPSLHIGDIAQVPVYSKEFGRIATQNAKKLILQKIREEERKVVFDQYFEKEKDIVTGIVQRYVGKNISINLGRADAMLTENEQVKGEHFEPTERIKLYIVEVKNTTKGPKILVSRTHPELVKRLFESEVPEIYDGTVEIKAISREAGSRSKVAVISNNPDVDALGACIGPGRQRISKVCAELGGEKMDVVFYSEKPEEFIAQALKPSDVIRVEIPDPEVKACTAIVPDNQLSLAIGNKGQNAKLAAKLTGFKIDIKSETQARESGDIIDYENDYEDDYEEEYSNEDEYPQKPETEEAYDEVSENEEINDTEVNEEADAYANTDDGDEE